MSPTAFPEAADLSELVEPAVALAERWLKATRGDASKTERQSSARLAALVRDPAGLDLAVRFVDRVARPESLRVAARELSRLQVGSPTFLSRPDRLLLGVGTAAAPLAPGIVVSLARTRLRQLIGHLIVADDPQTLSRRLRRAHMEGFRLNLGLLGDTVLGDAGAEARVAGTQALLQRPDVDCVSVNVSALAPQLSPWDIPGGVRRVGDPLRRILRTATNACVNLDVEEYQDLDLTVAVFTSLLREEDLLDISAGVALQAYFPDSRAALEELLAVARWRDSRGGAPIKIRIVKGANLSLERVGAEAHGWVQASFPTKEEVDANYLALIDRALSARHGAALRVGVASHNLYDIALASLLARGRGVADRVDIEMLHGMAPAKARAVRDTVGNVVLYTPVVARDDLDVAVAYLIRRLEENAQPENFLRSLFAGELEEQEMRFRASVAAMRSVATGRRRSPDRAPAPPEFANTTDSDPALQEVRAWAAERVGADPAPPRSPELTDEAAVAVAVETAREAGATWGQRTGEERAAVLRRAADEIEARRGELLTALVQEGSKTVAEADPEISEAVDFARWYADRARDLTAATEGRGGAESSREAQLLADGARFTPHTLTVVASPGNFPVAMPASGALAALAAGSAVLIKPSGSVPRCAEIVAEALHAAGVPAAAAQVVRLPVQELGRTLIAHPGVDGVVLTGSPETAEQFIGWRAGRPGGHGVIAATSGKNALVITPAADYDLAVADAVRSAFGHAGQKRSAASLAILVGEVGESERFRSQLVDAVASVRVGWPQDLGAVMGPLLHEPDDTLLRGLTRLDPGESWLVQPRQLDDSGRLWSPGVREGVRPASWFHRTACFGPVLGVLRAKNLKEALALQNAVGGLTGGLHSLDSAEIERWLAGVEVGSAYVNRPITGALVGRQPFGGWKASVVGPGAKAGGPDYVAQLGQWSETALPELGEEPTPAMEIALQECLDLFDDAADRAWLIAAVRSDARAWRTDLGVPRDPSGLAAEENTLRRLPAPLTVRGLAGARLVEVLRVVLAARLVEAPVRLSLAEGPERRLATTIAWLASCLDPAETDEAFEGRARECERVRLIGPNAMAMADRLSAPGVMALAGPVLANGHRELLTVVREQTVSRTRHRHGHLSPSELPDAGS